ncbi:MAG TPA: TIR domain-containing protein [Pyrinomonadaceae bacterium]|nr:TIR domain-containing protein [Pyrinomonadaceae bacterium]
MRKRVEARLPLGIKLLRTIEEYNRPARSLVFDPTGEKFATASDESVRLFETDAGALLRVIEESESPIYSLAFNPHEGTLASGDFDGMIRFWDVNSCKLLRTLEGHVDLVTDLAFDQRGERLASSSRDSTVRLWEVQSGKLLRTFIGHKGDVNCVVLDPRGDAFISASDDATIRVWEPHSSKLPNVLRGHHGPILSLAFDPRSNTLVSASFDKTLKLWDLNNLMLLRTIEGHTAHVDMIRLSSDGRFLLSKSGDQTIRLWNCKTWETVAVIPSPTEDWWAPSLALHPNLPLFAVATTQPRVRESERTWQINLWELDHDVLLDDRIEQSVKSAVHHTTGKIVLLGDHSVGKSALGHRLIQGAFKEQASTHGQQFWVFPALGQRRADDTECEAILWDFAGQPDYRLVHALFVDNADLALVLFDASNIHDPLHGVAFWLKQLQAGESRCPIILVPAQTDRGTSPLTPEELDTFCKTQGIIGPIATSAFTGVGIDELIAQMKVLIAWDDKPATVTTNTFKRIKDFVLGLKETEAKHEIVTPDELRERLEADAAEWNFSDDEMLTAVGHLENYGYVKRLRTSKGELRILLQPERLNNLASSFVLEARRNPKGLGALEETRLLAGGYNFPELKDLAHADRDILLDSAALLFLEHNVCFRETDPLRMEPYLVFPELINLKKPPEKDAATEDGAAYTVTGPTENVFASLVVLLGYTHTFTRTAQWHNNARYEVGDGLVCGFRQEAERDGELDFVLCFGPTVGLPVRTLFQGLFESFLARRNLTVMRYEAVCCSNPKCGQLLERSVVRQRTKQGKTFAFCNECGAELPLPTLAEPIQLTREVQIEVESQQRVAEQRTHFEQAVFRLHAYIAEQEITPPECFISYAWGVPEHERWVEKRLATDLQKAGINVLLDRWHNAQFGTSVMRFVERIEESDKIIAVGTPLYRQKAKNVFSDKGSVVAAEYDLAGIRLLATEDQKQTVLPVLLAGDESKSFPALLRGRHYADFRNDEDYFVTAFALILNVYDLSPNHPAVADLRESLLPPGFVYRN